MLIFNIFILLSVQWTIFAAPIALYEKKANGEVTLFLPESQQLAIKFAPRITLRILTQILRLIATERDRQAGNGETEDLVELSLVDDQTELTTRALDDDQEETTEMPSKGLNDEEESIEISELHRSFGKNDYLDEKN